MTEFAALCTMTLDLAPSLSVGTGPAGDRSIGGVRTAVVSGERLNARLAGPAAADWLVRTGAIGVIDARLVLRTHDDALIYVSYGGRLDLSNPAAGLYAYIAPVFETGDPRYAWLNAVQAAGKGKLTLSADGATLVYDLYEVR
ncbi:DUF3237 domain-containing protein [Novosphingobium sp. MMS21-SN21R]|uniref:DUF3237 domain-containing protein n=1 Tax=Novosphingobium sp. MMS21-SN21R TaxID=2969298 RepID=UPI002885CD24|nr:DUF3237 domain-containing protein [Novosphingobium sp. MMS21-SN21R]MDT0509856.1 DUF3237 domain-containing protein [Novosphingobium sp. MMS21-SN21R]